ncbi:MAG TPA: hypothetical protein VG244_08640 [Acidimicrobiales bacterium]|nr:hypothetical protein [Acidimicrobiales bacterium]
MLSLVTVLLGSIGTASPVAGATSAHYSASALLQPYTTDPSSPVIHDTETDALVDEDGRIFASTDQWEYSNPTPAGQILVKDSGRASWRVFEQTQGLRVEDTIAAFKIPSDQGLGAGHALLITQADLHGQQVLQWLLDDASSFTTKASFVLPSNTTDVRSFGAHESNGVWSVYAGVEPTGVLRGAWSKTAHTLVFSSAPELTVDPSTATGVRTQKVTAFAECSGTLYVTINTTLFRRNEGVLAPGADRWEPVYTEPPVGAYNSGLRGLTCVSQGGRPALLFSSEGSGDVYRIDHLPQGQLSGTTTLKPILEFTPISAVRQMLASEGTTVPTKGTGSIQYVIAAYNNFTSLRIAGVTRQVFGFEWGYVGSCPATSACGPQAFSAIDFDARACFAVRTPSSSRASYELRCLTGRGLRPPGRPASGPIHYAQAFVSIRTIVASPFGDNRVYYGGYDCNFYPADGTAWVASSQVRALDL